MNWLQAIKKTAPRHKYAINAALLGDDQLLAWSNLGYWDQTTSSYTQACRQLASHLADSISLDSNDRLLDLGCGQGASLLLWQQAYGVKVIEAVEIQQEYVTRIKNNLPDIPNIHSDTFLRLQHLHFQTKFDAVICVDALYHSDLNAFFNAVTCVMQGKGRLGFHTLLLTDRYDDLDWMQKFKYKILLKCADVNINHLLHQKQLIRLMQQHHFQNTKVEDLSGPVLNGFAQYIESHPSIGRKLNGLDGLKIRMTAKLCEKLYAEGVVSYVQVSSQFADHE